LSGLGLPSNVIWSTAGTISVSGFWTGGPGAAGTIEPIAMAVNTSAVWTTVSPFFGSPWLGPGGGPLTGSKPVNSLTANVIGGNLSLGVQSILMLDDPIGAGGNSMNLPTSLHLSVTLTPVEVPEPSTFALAGTAVVGVLAVWKRRARGRC
jgi:hypothetical protein